MKQLLLLFTVLFTFLSTIAQYNDPYRMTYDGSNYFITNKGNGTVSKLDVSGNKTTAITGLSSPNDIFFGNLAGNNVLMILDDNKIKVYNSTTYSSVLSIAIPNTTEAHDGVFNPSNANEFFVSDRAGNKILKGSIGSPPLYPITFSTFISNIKKPAGMIFNSQGKLIVVSDTTDAKVYEINVSNANIDTVLSSSLDKLNDVAQDKEGNYYVSCWGNSNLYRYSNSWTNQYTVATFNHPSGLYADTTYDILGITCTNCQKVEFKYFHLFSPASDVTTCVSDSFYASFIPTYRGIGTYNTDNSFTVEMSDSNGSFSTPVEIGRITTTTRPTSIKAAIPVNHYATTGYKYRLAATSPETYSYFTKNLTALAKPTSGFLAGDTIYGCIGIRLELKHNETSNVDHSFYPPVGITVIDSATFNFTFTSVDSIYYYTHQVIDNTTGCSSVSGVVFSISAGLKISLADTMSMCEGDTISLGNNTSTYAYNWRGSSSLSSVTAPSPTFYGTKSTLIKVVFADSGITCFGYDSTYVIVKKPPRQFFTLQELEFCLGDTIFSRDYSNDSVNFTYINNAQSPLEPSGWLADSVGRFSYRIVYTDKSNGCSDSFGNGYGVHYNNDSVRINNQGDYIEAQVYGKDPQRKVYWFINNVYVSNATSDTLNKDRLQDGDSIFAKSVGSIFCSVFSNAIIWKTSSISNAEVLFSVIPNPSNGRIKIASNKHITSHTIRDLQGKIVYQNNNPKDNTITTTTLHGIYILEVETTDGIGRKRLIIN